MFPIIQAHPPPDLFRQVFDFTVGGAEFVVVGSVDFIRDINGDEFSGAQQEDDFLAGEDGGQAVLIPGVESLIEVESFHAGDAVCKVGGLIANIVLDEISLTSRHCLEWHVVRAS